MLTEYDKRQMALDKQRAAKRDHERVAELEAELAASQAREQYWTTQYIRAVGLNAISNA